MPEIMPETPASAIGLAAETGNCHTDFQPPKPTHFDISAIRIEMAENAAARAQRKQSLRSAKADAYVAEADPARWDAEYDALVEQGIDDIVIMTRRVSGYGQGDAYGLDAQARTIRAFIVMKESQTEGLLFPRKAADISIVDVDSGKEESRVGMEWIRAKVKEGKIRGVIAFKGDRIARNVLYNEMLQREFKAAKCRIWSATEDIPDNAYGNCFRQVLAVFAELELSVIASRLNNGRKEMVRQTGGYLGGGAPYGYEIVGSRWDSGKGVIVVCQAEARVVRLIFDLYGRGYNQMAITEYLNRNGIPTRHDAPGGWAQTIVRQILMREAGYRAERLFNDFAADWNTMCAHEPILPHRADPADRTYLFGNVKRRTRVRVPDDPTAEPLQCMNTQNTLEVLDPVVAEGLLVAIRQQAQGLTFGENVAMLNAAGYISPKGLPWKKSNLGMHLIPERRERLLDAIRAVGVTAAPEQVLPPTPEQVARAKAEAAEIRAVARIKQLRAEHPDLSHRKLTHLVNAESLVTVDGKPWAHQMVTRIINGVPRQSEINSAKIAAVPRPRARYMAELSPQEVATARHMTALYDTGMYSQIRVAEIANERWPHPQAQEGRVWSQSDVWSIVHGKHRWKQLDRHLAH